MSDPTTSSSNRITSLKHGARLYRIVCCAWALGGLLAAIYGDGSRVALCLGLCAVFLVLGRSKARQAAALAAQETEPQNSPSNP